ncbi:hypothetical protein CJF30_00011423 [Rutstroemia sp. NJR-2017a BBW]|nr:hypothetical protein CJF30_00011423 [Rutstroemia sp. NJR-2017a BBW]
MNLGLLRFLEGLANLIIYRFYLL